MRVLTKVVRPLPEAPGYQNRHVRREAAEECSSQGLEVDTGSKLENKRHGQNGVGEARGRV